MVISNSRVNKGSEDTKPSWGQREQVILRKRGVNASLKAMQERGDRGGTLERCEGGEKVWLGRIIPGWVHTWAESKKVFGKGLLRLRGADS